MATLHGKNSMLYMSDGTNQAEKISEAAEWTLDVNFDEDPDPALGDSWKTRLKGLLEFSGSFSGNFDDAQDTLWDASIASTSAKFYLYPASGQSGRYYHGNIWPKVSIGGGVSGKETFSVSFTGDGTLSKIPA